MTNGGLDPEETQPFNAPPPPPYGWTPPAPPPTPTPTPAPTPTPTPTPTQPYPPYSGYGPGWPPAYGAALPGSRAHTGATTALVLGIVAAVGLVLTPLCCITLPAVLCGPFAWYVGSRALQEMDDAPGVYGNRGSARGGRIMGIVTTAMGVVAVLAVLAVVAVLVLVGWEGSSLG